MVAFSSDKRTPIILTSAHHRAGCDQAHQFCQFDDEVDHSTMTIRTKCDDLVMTL